jgi:uncharacterized surface protein with fasciclin (FAS1) repeats
MTKKRIFTLIFFLILIAIAGISLYYIINGGDNSQANENTKTTTATTSSKDISSFVSSNKSLSKYYDLLQAANLNNTLSGTNQKLIILAPENSAYNTLPKDYYDSLISTKTDSAIDIAKYSIITVTSDQQLTDGQKLKTQEGQEVIVGVNSKQTTFTDAKGTKAVAKTIQKTSNGTLYIISAVMLPQ